MTKTVLLAKFIASCSRGLAELALAPLADPKAQEKAVTTYQKQINRATMHLRGYHQIGSRGFDYWTRTINAPTSPREWRDLIHN